MKLLQRAVPGVRSLRDVSLDLLREHKHAFDATIYKRCEYVVRENARVLQACGDLQRGDFRSFGQRMVESHEGLRDDYQVSSPELDALVELAASVNGVLGARMMGAGFGGCTINLVEEPRVDEFVRTVGESVLARSGHCGKVYITKIQSGTARLIGEQIHV